jgi:hypothetical protein
MKPPSPLLINASYGISPVSEDDISIASELFKSIKVPREVATSVDRFNHMLNNVCLS